ncbi:hypothetical protein GCM10023166_10190 [Paeniglutamicibacter cryotolerans]
MGGLAIGHDPCQEGRILSKRLPGSGCQVSACLRDAVHGSMIRTYIANRQADIDSINTDWVRGPINASVNTAGFLNSEQAASRLGIKPASLYVYVTRGSSAAHSSRRASRGSIPWMSKKFPRPAPAVGGR